MSRHLYRFFTEPSVQRSMRCKWSDEDGGVTSRGEKQVLSLLNADDDLNFQAIPESKPEEIPTGALSPAQYQAGEDDWISTFRKTKATVAKGSLVQSFSQAKPDDDSTTNKSRSDEGSLVDTTTTNKSKRSKSSLNSKTLTIASELTSSMDTMNQNVNTMQMQFVALMERLDVMNDRVGILEVGPENPKRPDRVSEKDKLPASTHPPEAKGGEKPS